MNNNDSLPESKRFMYPNDNSYATIKATGESAAGVFLAGTAFQDAKRVKVISKPYIKYHFINLIHKVCRDEFIDVEYEGVVYSILNDLRYSPPARVEYSSGLFRYGTRIW